jgi:hypothetical protein
MEQMMYNNGLHYKEVIQYDHTIKHECNNECLML